MRNFLGIIFINDKVDIKPGFKHYSNINLPQKIGFFKKKTIINNERKK